MTHFNVLVIGDDWEKQLAPFNDCCEPGSPYLEFEDHTGEWGVEWETMQEKSEYNSFLYWVKDWHGGSTHEGSVGVWNNPNGKWDWYAMGGRWSGMLQVWDGRWAARGEDGVMDSRWSGAGWDQCRIGDISLEGIKKINTQRMGEIWDKAKERSKTIKGKLVKELYGFDPSKTTKKELVDKEEERFPSFKAILKSGEWHEIESVNFFKSTDEEREKWEKICNGLLEDVNPDTLITVVDCHN